MSFINKLNTVTIGNYLGYRRDNTGLWTVLLGENNTLRHVGDAVTRLLPLWIADQDVFSPLSPLAVLEAHLRVLVTA